MKRLTCFGQAVGLGQESPRPGGCGRGFVSLGPRSWLALGVLLLFAGPGLASTQAAVLREDFAQDPIQHGWRVFGDSGLFRWEPASQALAVTWDSSHSNSFIYLPLGTILTAGDDFELSFDLKLADIQPGSTPGKSNEFEIAVGLLQYASATNMNAYRGAGVNSTYGVHNLVEFDYFPDTGFGDTWATTVVSTNNRIYPVHNFPLALTTGDTFRITFVYTAADQVLQTLALRNGLPFGLPPDHTLAALSLAGKADFRVDAFAVTSYSDAIQAGPPSVHGSVLAHGTVDNVELLLPPLPVTDLRGRWRDAQWQVEFNARSNWTYTLERTVDWQTWTPTAGRSSPSEAALVLIDATAPASAAYYRVRAERP